jgi:pimeloyl-ACP methyl ester carboxylesterase
VVFGLCSAVYAAAPQTLSNYYEKQCINKGWNKLSQQVESEQRKILWRAPEGAWRRGAIIVLHGGGGSYSNYCASLPINQPMIDFAELALKNGFAVFSPDSADGLSTDALGNSCGKRWASVADDRSPNPDVLFIRHLITDVLPQLRPAKSSANIFLTGISNGGLMTVLASTQLADYVTAFAPISAGDPYGMYMDCREGLPIRPNAPGGFYDLETNQPINRKDACISSSYTHESVWPSSQTKTPRAFKMFYSEDDAAIHTSCKEKAVRQLRDHGYQRKRSYVLKSTGRRTIIGHFWQKSYNRPLLNFFSRFSGQSG